MKKHIIHPTWLRIILKTVMWFIVAVILIPVLLYIPPVQTLVKNIACDAVKSSTGMEVGIDRLRLRFPLDLALDGVKVIEAGGDTMVMARSAELDVKLLPLLKMDVEVQRLRLLQGYYRMVSPDSSMILKLRAGELMTENPASVNLRNMNIILDEATLRNGDVQLYMDVWKKKPTSDTTSTDMLIKANRLRLENFTFAMSMLPTIDTLNLKAKSLTLTNGVVDLGKSRITASSLSAADGDVVYLTPTPEYVAAHPVPVDTVSPPSPPMIISGDSVALDRFKVLYAVKGAKPLPGFDASYIQLTDVNAGVRGFYNAASTLRVPVTRLTAKERCGLQVTQGCGQLDIDSAGLTLRNLDVRTPWSKVNITAGLPFALMQLQPSAPLDVRADASVGWPDIEAFMPTLATYTKLMPRNAPLNIALNASGQLDNADVKRFDAAIPGSLSLRASGTAQNALDFKRLTAALKFDGELSNPSLVKNLVGMNDLPLPTMHIAGSATARNQVYGADFRLTTPQGNVVADGNVSMTSEQYKADVTVDNFNVAPFAPTLGVGHVSARLQAEGAGFNPEKAGAATQIILDLNSAEYNRHLLRDLYAKVTLHDGVFDIDAASPNPDCDFSLTGSGEIAPDDYKFDINADLRHVDLRALGLSDTVCAGGARLTASGSASPARWLYDIDLDLPWLDWKMGEETYSAPGGVTGKILSTPVNTLVSLDGDNVSLLFESPYNMKKVVADFSGIASSLPPQLAKRRIDMQALQDSLPMFRLRANGNDTGLLAGFLQPAGIGMDTLSIDLGKDSIVKGRVEVLKLSTSSLTLDTITMRLKQRGEMLDYAIHVGNGAGPLSEFADVNLNGYLATNRLALSLNQHNIKGEQGYRLGLTTAIADSIATVHFTPLSATIGYMPWKFNLDNHVDYNFNNNRIDAKLQAKSNESSILLQTEDIPGSQGNSLHLNLDNIKIEQFLNMMMEAPPLTGVLNTDLRLQYDGHSLEGNGDLTLDHLTYDRVRVGNLNLTLDAGRDNAGDTRATVGLKVNGNPAMAIHTELVPDSTGGSLTPKNTFLSLMEFPLSVANPFLGADLAKLSGTVSGRMDLTGDFKNPVLNGQIACDSVGVFIKMLGSTLHLGEEPITVRDNVLRFNRFEVFGANTNPLTLNGTVDASRLNAIQLGLNLHANNFQLIGNAKKAGGDMYGKLFMNLDASATGPLQHFDINANLNVLGTTDVTYELPMTADELASVQNGNVVKFVNFSDTTQVVKADSLASSMTMRINASATLSPGCQVTVIIPNTGTGNGKVQLTPSGTLNYYQNFMGDMRLNGTVQLGTGYARYTIPLVGEKKFSFLDNSFITWNGQLMNPTLNIHGIDDVKANVSQGNTTQLVVFQVGLNVTGNLSAPKVQFDLSTEDDMSIENELQSMSPDQRSTQAMNLLLTGQYSGPGAKSVNSNMVTGQLYNILAAQLNALAAKTIKGVDLTFGVDQYESGTNGQTQTTTSYSYQVSKSLFNNRFKILVGGNYTTDAAADENFTENLISDISFEYILRQTATTSLSAKLFRHMGYENVLEGEITETGVGLVLKRRLNNLRSLFNMFGRRKKSNDSIPAPADSIPADGNQHDSIAKEKAVPVKQDSVPTLKSSGKP